MGTFYFSTFFWLGKGKMWCLPSQPAKTNRVAKIKHTTQIHSFICFLFVDNHSRGCVYRELRYSLLMLHNDLQWRRSHETVPRSPLLCDLCTNARRAVLALHVCDQFTRPTSQVSSLRRLFGLIDYCNSHMVTIVKRLFSFYSHSKAIEYSVVARGLFASRQSNASEVLLWFKFYWWIK